MDTSLTTVPSILYLDPGPQLELLCIAPRVFQNVSVFEKTTFGNAVGVAAPRKGLHFSGEIGSGWETNTLCVETSSTMQ